MPPRQKGIKIEYFNEEADGEQAEMVEEPTTTVEAEFVEVADSNPPLQEEAESPPEYDDLDDYVFEERVGTLELINYLPRIPKAVLRGERDFTPKEWAIAQEDYSRGYRPLEEKYRIQYQVPDEASKFRVQEDLSREIAKVSPGLVGKWVKATTSENPRRFPTVMLKDSFGFTQYAVAIYRNLMRYTCTRRFIPNEDGVIEWDSINRDDPLPPIKNPELSEDNPDYALSSTYWQKLAEQWLDYCDRMAWIAEYKNARSLREQEPEVINLGNESDRQLAQEMSQFAAKTELMKQAALQYLSSELEDLNRKAAKVAKQAGAKGRADALEAYAEGFNQGEPQIPEEEADLWSGIDPV